MAKKNIQQLYFEDGDIWDYCIDSEYKVFIYNKEKQKIRITCKANCESIKEYILKYYKNE